ncbi:MAG: leucyl/phenylalanyl-tRNA--protein transferase [Yoonia sp.]|nr:leucyl/phenylalanyl-tRNA--protein transferase [Yoonia sp.]
MTLTPDLLLNAYASGVFPMAENRDDPDVFWVDPQFRGVIPLDDFRISRSLAKTLRRAPFQITLNTAFEQVVTGCADRPETWINDTIFDLYRALHARGDAHAIEIWDGPDLVGGVYGITIGGAFFGESMFSRRRDASKVALAYLVDHLSRCGFVLFDTQFITDHLASLGAIEIPRKAYQAALSQALQVDANFLNITVITDAYALLQRNAQTS